MAFKKKTQFNVRSRPNKLAKGMTQTAYYCNHVGRMNADASRLSVKGTCDTLARMMPWYSRRTDETCTHCGNRLHKLLLNDSGRRRLANIKRRRQHVDMPRMHAL